MLIIRYKIFSFKFSENIISIKAAPAITILIFEVIDLFFAPLENYTDLLDINIIEQHLIRREDKSLYKKST